jgi:hypothetical protein
MEQEAGIFLSSKAQESLHCFVALRFRGIVGVASFVVASVAFLAKA